MVIFILYMMVNTMATQAEAGFNPISGTLEVIPGIPNLGETDKNYAESLFNAENVTITDEGRIFVTGSLEVCEVVKVGDTYQLRIIPIETSDGSRNYFRNGITARGNSLYLACTHIHKDKKPLFPNLLGDIRKIEQNWLGFLLFVLACGVCKVDSYILRADLGTDQKKQVLKFTDEIPLHKNGKCFANGIGFDEKGNLYVANELAGLINKQCFFKVPPWINSEEPKPELIVFSTPDFPYYDAPNGLKVKDNYVYYTCLQLLPVTTACLKRVEINESGSFGDVEVIYQSYFSIFDDFDIVKNGFVIANIMNIPNYGAGSLLFVESHLEEGKLKGKLRAYTKSINSKVHIYDGHSSLV